MISVSDILNDPRFSHLKLINNEANLKRRVSTIESTETPDVYNYIPVNTFLLTTAMIYKDNQDALCELIKKLNNLPISALGIKLGRFIDKLEPKVIDTANELGFPLILIPKDMTTGEVFLDLLTYIWDNKNEELLYVFNIQKKFYNLTLKDASINMLVKSLSHTLEKPVALIDPFGNINVSTKNIVKNYYKTSIRNIIENISNNKHYEKSTKIKIINSNYEENDAYIYPIKISNHYPHYLIIFNSKDLKFPLSEMIIEQASLVIVFTLYKNLRLSYNLMSAKEEFITDLIKRDTYEDFTEEQIVSIGTKYSIPVSNSYQVILASFEKKDVFIKNTLHREERYTLIYNWLDNKVKKDSNSCVLFPDRENFYFILILCGDNEDFEEQLSRYRRVLQKTLMLDIQFSIGNKVSKLEDLKYSYGESKDAISKATTKNDIDFIRYYKPLEANDLLRFVPDSQLETFSSYTLKALANPKNNFQVELKNTLKTYLEFNCDISKTAEALFIHRNTVLYRIKRCEELLGRSIDDPNFNLGLRLSLLPKEN